ncbi:hypothetical protein [Catenovulum maritimum]|uniref:Uncharacterized protein n=1 Tax=Catenovulum maritimum TaxID=1513271 RepID=A0A0J8GTC6_9ALTE|nr:hypothetical protein [Catenovulum maritimum]KMT66005.1 hypothetical protein XM47_06010 [Catenovulum maritimum]
MSINSINNSLNQSILNSTFGDQSNSLVATSVNQNITNQLQTKEELLANVATQQIGQTSQILSGISGGDSVTNELVSLSVNSNNALSATELSGDASNVVGRIINEIV